MTNIQTLFSLSSLSAKFPLPPQKESGCFDFRTESNILEGVRFFLFSCFLLLLLPSLLLQALLSCGELGEQCTIIDRFSEELARRLLVKGTGFLAHPIKRHFQEQAWQSKRISYRFHASSLHLDEACTAERFQEGSF